MDHPWAWMPVGPAGERRNYHHSEVTLWQGELNLNHTQVSGLGGAESRVMKRVVLFRVSGQSFEAFGTVFEPLAGNQKERYSSNLRYLRYQN